MISKIDGALEKISSSEHDLTHNCGKWSQKQIFKWKVDNGWPKDTAWFPFICLLATVYFRPLSIWSLKKSFWLTAKFVEKKSFFSGKENPRSLPFPHFPLYAALEHSAPTCCGKINILNHFVKETLKKLQYGCSLLRFWSSCQQISNLLKHMIPHLLQKHTVTSKSVSILSQASEKGNLMSFITSANKPPLHVFMYHISQGLFPA